MIISGRRKKRHRRFLIFVLLLIAGSVVFLELRLKPVTASVASLQAKTMATTAINEAAMQVFEETGIDEKELEEISVSADGNITSISTNTAVTNRLKNLITLKAQESIENIRNRQVDVPLGTVIGGDLINGSGPRIPVCISMSGTVESDFESSFESGGINQTVHTLYVRIKADVRIIMPFGSFPETVETSVLAGETVVVGAAPSGMIMTDGITVGQKASSDSGS